MNGIEEGNTGIMISKEDIIEMIEIKDRETIDSTGIKRNKNSIDRKERKAHLLPLKKNRSKQDQ